MNVRTPADPLEELLSEIESITEGNRWSMELDDVLMYTQVSREDVMRAVYAMRRTGTLTRQWEHFSADNVDDLVFILSECGYPDAPRMFRQRGYFLNEKDHEELLEVFISVTVSRMKSRAVDRDQLEIAIAGSRDFHAAAEFYCHSVFSTEEMINFAVSVFVHKRGIEDCFMARTTAGGYLRGEFHRRSLRWEDIFAAIFDDLRAKAVFWNLTPGMEAPPVDMVLSKETRKALSEMGFPTEVLPSPQELKTRYRKLVKKYHPDVNPEGLEKTRTLNACYSHLIACSTLG
ncbi:MAG: J domain-containing protein [Spirochaetia bacterium]|nr:J domain-containing protein [Spirochaetia bacterium]